MWRILVKNFGRSIIKNSTAIAHNKNTVKIFFNNQLQQRLFACSALLHNTETVRELDGQDEGYIIPYNSELEKPDNAAKIIQTLRTKFHLSKEEVELILSNEIVIRRSRGKSLISTLEILSLEGITKNNIIEYPWLITLNKNSLVQKIKLLKSLNGFRNINDFVPFLRLQLHRLRTLVYFLKREVKIVDYGNRVYYIAEKLNVLPCIVSKFLAKRLFVLEMPFDMFKTNLQHMINYNVEPMNILKDLWGFRYAPHAVENRLQRALHAKKDKIMPWMVRCTEPILQKSLKLSLDEMQILGENNTIADYIGKRLGFSTEEAQAIMDRHPQVNVVRVAKIKEVLDYLLDEAKFEPFEIAMVPRILCHKLETTKQRIKELEKYGCRPSSLVIVCRSKREYEKFLKQWQNRS